MRSPNLRITDAALPTLGTLAALTSLNLTHSRVTSAGIAQLSPLQNLTTLALNGCKVSMSSITQLQRRCPKLVDVGLANQ